MYAIIISGYSVFSSVKYLLACFIGLSLTFSRLGLATQLWVICLADRLQIPATLGSVLVSESQLSLGPAFL